MEEPRHRRRRKRVRARSFVGAAAISASLTPAVTCAFLTHQHHPCHGPTRPPQRTAKAPEKAWQSAREGGSLRRMRCLPAHTEEMTDWRFKPLKWPPLVRSTPKRGGGGGDSGRPRATESELVGDSTLDLPGGLTDRSKPSAYQVDLFRSIMECERNSLVHLPTASASRTVVASLVLGRLLELNPGRQAFFLVETTALAVQQAARLRDEVDWPIATLTGSAANTGGRGDPARKRAKLESVRAASVVVATAGGFELAMREELIDPDSICCVVLDEAQRCAKEHPFGRIARSFLTAGATPSASVRRSKSASELPKVLALTASPAGELTVLDTVVKIEKLLDRLEADLVAPVGSFEEVERLSSPVDLELAYVALTSAEITLLTCLQRLVLSRVVKRAPEGSDVRAEAKSLLDGVDHWVRRPGDTAAAAPDTKAAAASSFAQDGESLTFPNAAYMALCNRAQARGSSGGREGDGNGDDSESSLGKLMQAAFAVDEIGGVANWRRVQGLLEHMRADAEEKKAGGDAESDPELEETLRVLKNYLPEDAAAAAAAAGVAAAPEDQPEPDPFGSKVAGSKLSQIALLLEQHKQECDESGEEFFALVLVSRRDLALQLPRMLEGVPSLKPFVKAEHVVGRRLRTPSFEGSGGGTVTVLVSTSSVAAGGIDDVPANALVVCTSLPSVGPELAQLRGRTRDHEGRTRFVGLTRASRFEEQAHAERLLTREKNMLEAVKLLAGGVGISYVPTTSVTPMEGVFPPPCFAAKNFASINLEDGGDGRWKKSGDLPATLTPAAARASSMVHLALCVKGARQTNPNQNARSAMNSAVQLAHAVKPALWYDEREEPSWYDGQMFRARCLVSCQPRDGKGLLLVKEGRGLSVKAAREAAAVKAVQYLLWVSKAHTAQPLDFAA
eukprot:g3328.t1